MAAVLIVGLDPDRRDLGALGVPPEVGATPVADALRGPLERLAAQGHAVTLLPLRGWEGPEAVDAQVEEALAGRAFDVVVVGAGLRVLPALAPVFERLMNALHEGAPGARFAFNSRPEDSDEAALRWLAAAPPSAT
jgi:hypothetical protein